MQDLLKKKIVALALTICFLTSYTGFCTTAMSMPEILPTKKNKNIEAIIPTKLEKEIRASIAKIYGSDNVDEIYANVERIALKTKLTRPQQLREEDLTRSEDWYKDEVIYMFYADQFGVKNDFTPNTFRSCIKMLDYLKTLGVTTIYILPFADSPMNDAGFDVRNPRNVRSDLGGLKEFKEFITAARNKGFKIKADLVLNEKNN